MAKKIRITCICGKLHQISDKFAGQNVRCEHCDHVMRIPFTEGTLPKEKRGLAERRNAARRKSQRRKLPSPERPGERRSGKSRRLTPDRRRGERRRVVASDSQLFESFNPPARTPKRRYAPAKKSGCMSVVFIAAALVAVVIFFI